MLDWTGYGILTDMDGVINSLYHRWIKPFEKTMDTVKPNYDREAMINSITAIILKYGGSRKFVMVRGLITACRVAGLSYFQIMILLFKLGLQQITKKNFEIVILDGVPETLKKLKEMNFKLALITTASRHTTKRVKKYYPEVYDCFDIVISRNDVKKTKPYPDPLLKAIEKLELDIDKTVMIGDLITDIIAGKNAGVKTVGILSEFPEITKEVLQEENPDLLLNSLEELPDALVTLFPERKET